MEIHSWASRYASVSAIEGVAISVFFYILLQNQYLPKRMFVIDPTTASLLEWFAGK